MLYDLDDFNDYGPAENEPKSRWWLWPLFLNPVTALGAIYLTMMAVLYFKS